MCASIGRAVSRILQGGFPNKNEISVVILANIFNNETKIQLYCYYIG